MSTPRLTLLGRPGCHLCEELRDELEQAFPGRFEVQEACVDDRAEWRQAYGSRIPVLLADDGQVLCEARFAPERLQALL